MYGRKIRPRKRRNSQGLQYRVQISYRSNRNQKTAKRVWLNIDGATTMEEADVLANEVINSWLTQRFKGKTKKTRQKILSTHLVHPNIYQVSYVKHQDTKTVKHGGKRAAVFVSSDKDAIKTTASLVKLKKARYAIKIALKRESDRLKRQMVLNHLTTIYRNNLIVDAREMLRMSREDALRLDNVIWGRGGENLHDLLVDTVDATRNSSASVADAPAQLHPAALPLPPAEDIKSVAMTMTVCQEKRIKHQICTLREWFLLRQSQLKNTIAFLTLNEGTTIRDFYQANPGQTIGALVTRVTTLADIHPNTFYEWRRQYLKSGGFLRDLRGHYAQSWISVNEDKKKALRLWLKSQKEVNVAIARYVQMHS